MQSAPCRGSADGDPSLIDLPTSREQAWEAWRGSADSHVPLPLAAALAFHVGREGADALLPERDYELALNAAAAALARVLAVYAVGENSTLAAIDIDMGSGHFRDGGAVYERGPGHRITPLVVTRAQLGPALEFVRAVGLPVLIPVAVR